MVSPFTLGLFAPLPLAMMIPFMATQSLAMGEAFGKSFQYGKRKISSMTNEEFNKLTFSQLMDEQTANIRQIIPKLHTQMEDSAEMQSDIFKEMTKLIPAFIEGLAKGTKEIVQENDYLNSLINPGETIRTSHTQANTQEQATIINLHTGGKNATALPTPTPSFTQNNKITEHSLSSTKQDFANRIKNYNNNTLNALLNSTEVTTQWQRDLIAEAKQKIIQFEKQDFSGNIPPSHQKLTPQQEAQKAYLADSITREQELLRAKTQLRNADARKTQSDAHMRAYKSSLAKVARIRKNWQNKIMLSRNNILLKSVANRDWNDRLWTK